MVGGLVLGGLVVGGLVVGGLVVGGLVVGVAAVAGLVQLFGLVLVGPKAFAAEQLPAARRCRRGAFGAQESSLSPFR